MLSSTSSQPPAQAALVVEDALAQVSLTADPGDDCLVARPPQSSSRPTITT
jgi:hypothetical protein